MSSPKFVALVPVKPPARGKSRLVGVPDHVRRELAEAFALDTVAACLATPRVARVLVATDDAAFSSQLAAMGADTIPDGVGMNLNETLRQGAAEAHRRWPDLCPAAVCADLPALRPDQLESALAQVTLAIGAGRAAFVADAEGLGTTLYAAPYADFEPRFGPDSAAAHRAAGAEAVPLDAPGLRRDVDDLDDLRAALLIGVGPHTRHRAAPLAEDGPAIA